MKEERRRIEQRAVKRAALNPPRGLEAFTFRVDDEEYTLFSFPLREVETPEGLTEAEREVVRAVLEGRRNAEIARARGAASSTVANQLQSIYRKLGVSNRRELIQRCLPGLVKGNVGG
ncbi:MAG: LuxR C-terminal-related transcriptional regulator [Polyangiaceae bacterium]|nr:LuxR C-terminal-related transcriptional regulator [Polyangiaceae bacterium]